jgi:hypothetical protein
MRILSSGVRLSRLTVPSGLRLSAPVPGIIRYRTQHIHYYDDQVWKVTGNHALHDAQSRSLCEFGLIAALEA